MITSNVAGLVDFYRHVLGIEPRTGSDRYEEFSNRIIRLPTSHFSQSRREVGHPRPRRGSTEIIRLQKSTSPKTGETHSTPALRLVAQGRHGAPLCDREYARLQSMVKTWVKSPTNQPWGARSIYFVIRMGIWVDFFVPVAR